MTRASDTGPRTTRDAVHELNASDISFKIGDRVDFLDGSGELHQGVIIGSEDSRGRVTIRESKNGHKWTRFPVSRVVLRLDVDAA